MSDERRIISKREAKAAGLRHYFTGRPCKRVHLCERLVSNGQCIECGRLYGVAKRRAAGIPDKASISEPRAQALASGAPRYFNGRRCRNGHLSERTTCDGKCVGCRDGRYQRHGDKRRAADRKYHEANKEKRQRSHKAWVEANRERYDEWQRAYRETNRSLLQIKDRAKYRANVEQRKADKHRRRAVEGSYTPDDIKRIFDAQKGRCAYCPKSIKASYHIDHIRPVSKGGTSWPSNLQLTCRDCNLSKKDKLPEDFARRRGLLL